MPVTVVENGSKTVATTGDRLPRMRWRCCINRFAMHLNSRSRISDQ
ncbi:MAG: hypothetical protein VB140_05800 [Burkholderia sp.]